MPSVAEIATAAGTIIGVVGISVAATMYVAGDGSGFGGNSSIEPVVENEAHRYVISDAYYLCRDHIDTAITQQVRNINVDSHSSRYDADRNDNVVFINLELIERVGEAFGSAQDAQIVCRVSAADNAIKTFQVNKG